MDVKLEELPRWILMRDFTPKGIAGSSQRGYYWYYNNYVNVKKGGVAGISMVLASYVLFKDFRLSLSQGTQAMQVPLKRAQCGGICGSPDHDLCLAPLNPFIS